MSNLLLAVLLWGVAIGLLISAAVAAVVGKASGGPVTPQPVRREVMLRGGPDDGCFVTEAVRAGEVIRIPVRCSLDLSEPETLIERPLHTMAAIYRVVSATRADYVRTEPL